MLARAPSKNVPHIVECPHCEGGRTYGYSCCGGQGCSDCGRDCVDCDGTGSLEGYLYNDRVVSLELAEEIHADSEPVIPCRVEDCPWCAAESQNVPSSDSAGQKSSIPAAIAENNERASAQGVSMVTPRTIDEVMVAMLEQLSAVEVIGATVDDEKRTELNDDERAALAEYAHSIEQLIQEAVDMQVSPDQDEQKRSLIENARLILVDWRRDLLPASVLS